jgi:CrcB protein
MTRTLSARRRVLAVLCGGFVGTITRYLLGLAIQGWAGKAWPYDILTVNLTGALVFAVVAVLADALFLVGPARRLLITTGFLGAYTTFSSLALGDVLLFSKGELLPALGYLLASAGGGLLAVLSGTWLGQLLVRRFRHESGKAHLLEEEPALAVQLDRRDDLALPGHPEEFPSRLP